MKKKQEYLDILRKINNDPNASQRDLSKNLGISLGKLNYCLNALKNKGLVKIQNFKKNEDRFNFKSKNNYFYILTPKGIALKTQLTLNFMKRKMSEYDELKKELKQKK
tara:strand:+ start:45 stop:368 length:324 start_codon:yes stop_codon:yes gene_type:complete